MGNEQDYTNEDAQAGVTRRGFLGMGAAGGALLAASGLLAGETQAQSPHWAQWPTFPHRTTLEHTLSLGRAGAGGYAPIVVRPGEPHLIRHELVDGQVARCRRRRVVTVLGQLTDVHIMDAQSPARVEYLDRYNDPTTRLPRCSRSTVPTGRRRCCRRR